MTRYTYATNIGVPLDELMISGFLSAMDSFIKELSGETSTLNEVDYQNFKINATMGKYVKVFTLTNESVDDAFRERNGR